MLAGRLRSGARFHPCSSIAWCGRTDSRLPPVHLLQGDDVRVELADHGENPLRIALAVHSNGLVNVIAGESELHVVPEGSIGRDGSRIAGYIAIRGLHREAVDALPPALVLARPVAGVSLGMVLEQRGPLALQRH